mmetsp:Transcript_44101/g.64816  ORF Transcript_44101/g.64816 Transcript_44101/m.64816 type:complete len:87 (-) Transcript_44101:118-378(-)
MICRNFSLALISLRCVRWPWKCCVENTDDEIIAAALTSRGIDAEKVNAGETFLCMLKVGMFTEGWINFHSEVSVMEVRSSNGDTNA